MNSSNLIRAWVADLRSGKYKRGFGRLGYIDDGSRCCLGVLCETYIRLGGKLVVGSNSLGTADCVTYNDCINNLPEEVRSAANLTSHDGTMSNDLMRLGTAAGRHSLTSLNDRGRDFREIADIIESKPPGLFLTKNKKNKVKAQK